MASGTGLANVSHVLVLAIDPSNPAILYAGTSSGVFRTTDAGANWSDSSTGLPNSSDVYALAIDPSNPAVVYAGTGGTSNTARGIFKSTDGGASWTDSSNGLTHPLISGLGVGALAIDPSNPAIVYAGTGTGTFTAAGIFKTTDGGATWTATNTGLPDVFTVHALAIDPSNPAIVYAGTGTGTPGGVFKTIDGGASWTASSTGLPDFPYVDTLAIDPSDPATLYAGTEGAGVFKSTDAGATWQPTAAVLEAAEPPIVVDPAEPAVNEGGVVNNASFAPSPAAVAPGSIVAIFGTDLNDGSTVNFSSFGSDGRLVTTLGGASVTINGIPAPLFYSTPTQLGIQIPFEAAGPTSATIQVTVGERTSAEQTIPLDPFAPGIFTASEDGRGAAAVLHEDGATPVSASNAARRGEIVVLYATGLGAVTPTLATGEPSTGNETVTPALVTIDDLPAEVVFSGAAPGFVGLYQINVRIPSNARIGPDVPLVLSIGGKQSNSVTIPVAE